MRSCLAYTLTVFLGILLVPAASGRIFTDRQGKTLDAELVQVAGPIVVLKPANGALVRVSFAPAQ